MIHHLVYNEFVFISKGYSENDGLFTYEIRGNFDEHYKVNGGLLIGKLKINPKNKKKPFTLSFHDCLLVSLADLHRPIRILLNEINNK